MRKIADPLREFARAASNDKEVIAHIDAIADEIDSEHERCISQETCKIDFDYEASRQCQGPIYRCDSCRVLVKDIETSEGKFKYCPNCGKRIKEETK